MGIYINPGNDGFARIMKDRYVDKTGLIGLVNGVVGTPRNMVCVTRPRRFGKSYAAESLVAYYCFGCDSRGLFEGLEISHAPDFEEHLNAYNVVRLDMTAFTGTVGADVVPEVSRRLMAIGRGPRRSRCCRPTSTWTSTVCRATSCAPSAASLLR